MKSTHLSSEQELLAFTERAIACFNENTAIRSFTDSGTLIAGEYLAIRWGLDDDCVVVMRIAEDFTPTLFQHALPQF